MLYLFHLEFGICVVRSQTLARNIFIIYYKVFYPWMGINLCKIIPVIHLCELTPREPVTVELF